MNTLSQTQTRQTTGRILWQSVGLNRMALKAATLGSRDAHRELHTALAFHVAALARCLLEFPRFNASLTADSKTLVPKSYVHIGIAVDTPKGLVVPVIRDADKLRIPETAEALSDLASRARARKLRRHEMGGASMNISSLGSIGGEAFKPIINPLRSLF